VDRQEFMDTFYFRHGPCCAGCDWWQGLSSHIGLCTKSAPVAGHERTAMVDMDKLNFPLPAGHIYTPKDHRCGDFKDEFDWSTLPLPYRKRVGAPL